MADGSPSESSVDKQGRERFEPIREIRVRGAREHNLKGVDIDIPRDRLVVITGLSGSGKSSLAFDTIFAEGQRKYMESLSAYARQFLDQQKKPDVESIEGLPPTIAIEQRTSGHNPRSTVATSTEIYDYLRLLFARAGQPHCWEPTKVKKDGTIVERCGEPIAAAHPTMITDAVSALPEGTRLMVLAPVVRQKKGFHREVIEDLAQDGYVRARVNGTLVDLAEVLADEGENPLGLGRYEKHDIEAVVDRLTVRDKSRGRLADSVETALRTSEGVVFVSVQQDDKSFEDTVYSEHYACSLHPQRSLDELEPRLFSFNSPQGACPACHGLGVLLKIDEDLVVPDASLALGKNGIAAFKKNGPAGMFARRLLRRFCRRFGVTMATPIDGLSPEIRQILLHGTTPAQEAKYDAEWEGVIPYLEGWFERTDSKWVKEFLQDFMAEQECPSCLGHRLNVKGPERHPSHHRAASGRGRPRPAAPRAHGRPAPDQPERLHAAEHRRRRAHPRLAPPHRRAGGHCQAHLPRGEGAPRLPPERGPRLPLAGAAHVHALGRRSPAHPAGDAGRVGHRRHGLRAR